MGRTNAIKFRKMDKGARAEIVLYGDIGFEITARDFSDELKALGDPEEIDVRVNSFGGDVFDGVTIYNRLKQHKARINVMIDGIAASAASVIAMAGDDITIGESAEIMIHEAWSMAMGDAEELRKKADKLENISAQMANLYQRRTEQPLEQIIQWMKDETFFTAEEAVAYGFADRASEAKNVEMAKYDPERHLFKRAPTVALADNMAEARRLTARCRMKQTSR